ncbi:MAG TPA: hypothetical protein VFB72_11915 [Verrucomicrobiae bacterium]|nr:hypothetical protein [Verrucomicrobiae bacterium]
MNNPSKITPPEDPEEQEAMREIAEEQEEKYGGRDRWILTGVFVVAALCSVWQFSQKQPLALFLLACTVLAAVLAIINWRSWLKKSPGEKNAISSTRFFKNLEIEDCSAPYSEAKFLKLRKAFGRNLALSAIAFMYALGGLMGVAVPQLSVRVISLSIAGAAIFLGRRPAQRVWRAGKGSLACPKCHDLLTSQASHVLRTGRCRKCGTLIITDEVPADAAAENSPEGIETSPAAERTRKRRSSRASRQFKPDQFQYDPRRILDVITLLSVPTFSVYYFGWNRLEGAGRLLIGIMILFTSALFCFMPDKLLGVGSSSFSHFKRGKKDIEPTSESAVSQPERLPLLDFAMMLAFPAAVIIGLSYLVWMHHVLTQLELALLTLCVPGAIVLVSYFVVRHEGHHVKKTGKPAPERFLWSIIALWVLAMFIFVVCLVSLIQKFWLKW